MRTSVSGTTCFALSVATFSRRGHQSGKTTGIALMMIPMAMMARARRGMTRYFMRNVHVQLVGLKWRVFHNLPSIVQRFAPGNRFCVSFAILWFPNKASRSPIYMIPRCCSPALLLMNWWTGDGPRNATCATRSSDYAT